MAFLKGILMRSLVETGFEDEIQQKQWFIFGDSIFVYAGCIQWPFSTTSLSREPSDTDVQKALNRPFSTTSTVKKWVSYIYFKISILLLLQSSHLSTMIFIGGPLHA